MTGMQDEYGDRPVARRVYIEDPYRGMVLLERDARTGRYYEANGYGYGRTYYYGNGPYLDYNDYQGRNNRYFRNNNRGYRDERENRRNDRDDRNGGSHYDQGGAPRYDHRDAPPRREAPPVRDEARKKVLGN